MYAYIYFTDYCHGQFIFEVLNIAYFNNACNVIYINVYGFIPTFIFDKYKNISFKEDRIVVHKTTTIKHSKLIFINKNPIYSSILFICQGILLSLSCKLHRCSDDILGKQIFYAIKLQRLQKFFYHYMNFFF